ncbi:unnamed protein product [Paramecium sonneborni]|uniref:Uncharacterized protein n=1 Tax=Paramecium sonneborni TaxID=65129 RepID=A0A8S1M1T5_9CILI|nr:unnamed protein product [Paramecium sonneborni]
MDPESNQNCQKKSQQNYSQEFVELQKLEPQNISKEILKQFPFYFQHSLQSLVGVKNIDISKLGQQDPIRTFQNLYSIRKFMEQQANDQQLSEIIIVDEVLIQRLIHIIEFNEIELLKLESVYVLVTIIVQGYFQNHIMQIEVLKVLLTQLKASQLLISMSSIVALGNLVLFDNEEANYGIYILENDGLDLISNVMNHLNKLEDIEICIWSLQNIFSLKKTHMEEDKIKKVIFMLCTLLNQNEDEKIVCGCFKIFSQFLPFTTQIYSILIESQTIFNLLKLIQSRNQNISKSSFDMIKTLIESNIKLFDQNLLLELLRVMKIIQKKKKYIIKQHEVFWCVSQFFVGSEIQQEILFQNKFLVSQIIKFILNSKVEEVYQFILNLAKFSQINNFNILSWLIKEQILLVLNKGLKSKIDFGKEMIVNGLQNVTKFINQQQNQQKIIDKNLSKTQKKIIKFQKQIFKHQDEKLILQLE